MKVQPAMKKLRKRAMLAGSAFATRRKVDFAISLDTPERTVVVGGKVILLGLNERFELITQPSVV